MPPRLFLIALLVLNLLLLAAAVTLGDHPDSLMREGKPITWLSAAQLFSVALLLGEIFRRKQAAGTPSKGHWLWLMMAGGFIFLGIDELTQLHENLNDWMIDLFSMPRTKWTTRIDDIIILIYGLLGMGVMARFRGELMLYGAQWPFLLGGGILFLLAVASDIFSHDWYFVVWLYSYLPWDRPEELRWFNVLEESLKVLTEAWLVAWAYACLRQTRQMLGNYSNKAS